MQTPGDRDQAREPQPEPQPDHERESEPAVGPAGLAPSEPPSRWRRLLARRPLSVYGVLLAGIAVLALLLVVVILTSRPEGVAQRPPCLDVDREEASRLINEGAVEQIHIVTDRDNVETGVVVVELDLVSDEAEPECRQLPQGIASQPDLERLVGQVWIYNETRAGEQRIAIDLRGRTIPPQLLATATPIPTPTPVPAPTATAEPTVTPEPTATATPEPTATVEPTPTATPEPAIPPVVASPPAAVATPELLAPPTPTPTPTSTPTPTPLPTLLPILTATPDPAVVATPPG